MAKGWILPVALSGGVRWVLSAEIGTVNDTTVVVTFVEEVSAVGDDYSSGVTIKVNGASVTVSSGTRQANHAVVYYVITPAVIFGDVVTWEYVAASGVITDGSAVGDVSAQNVINNVAFAPFGGVPWIAQWKENDNGEDSIGIFDLTDNGSPSYVTGKLGNALQCVAASTQYQNITDNATLSMANTNYYIAGWFQMTTLPTAGNAMALLSKEGGAGNSEYRIDYLRDTSRFRWLIWNAANSIYVSISAATFGAASINTWYFIEVYHDADNDLAGIAINGGAFDTAATGGASPKDSTADFRLGARSTGTIQDPLNGLIDAVVIAKGTGAILDSTQRAALYNSGSGTETIT
jgi:hypothetical protein